jgi:hypothetical protein
MKSILVLYPIQPYADVLIGEEELPEIKVRYGEIYQGFIRKRYPNFQMVCVMFSASGDLAKPDTFQLLKGFSVNGSDIIGACGVTFEHHCKKHIYPKEEKIIGLCPQPVEELVVTGFHLWDCVDKVAKYAYSQGINVSVDEDLTELFFYSVRGPGGTPPILTIPISREKSLKHTRKELKKAGKFFLRRSRAERKQKPWMAQI